MGRDKAQTGKLLHFTHFNPRARMGRDRRRPTGTGGNTYFNPRARMGRDQVLTGFTRFINGFQSTRPHGARQAKYKPHVVTDDISIHAPAWGATRVNPINLSTFSISIHAPAWGATRVEFAAEAKISISIHAPAWGATCCGMAKMTAKQFQSTRPHGARQQICLIFQETNLLYCMISQNFN